METPLSTPRHKRLVSELCSIIQAFSLLNEAGAEADCRVAGAGA